MSCEGYASSAMVIRQYHVKLRSATVGAGRGDMKILTAGMSRKHVFFEFMFHPQRGQGRLNQQAQFATQPGNRGDCGVTRSDDLRRRCRFCFTMAAYKSSSRALPRRERVSESRIAKGEHGIWQRRYWEHTCAMRGLRAPCEYIITIRSSTAYSAHGLALIVPSLGSPRESKDWGGDATENEAVSGERSP